MVLNLKFYGSYCATSVFEINGIDADYSDFGEKYDDDPSNAPDYGCGFMTFKGKEQPTKEVLYKYSISVEEYQSIVRQLEKGLTFGHCAWCS